MCRYFETRQGGEYLQPAGAGGMGYAIPAALGVKSQARTGRWSRCAATAGSACRCRHCCRRSRKTSTIVIVVFCNGILGWVRHSQVVRGEELFKSVLERFDYAAIGGTIGLAAFHVTSPAELAPAIATRSRRSRPWSSSTCRPSRASSTCARRCWADRDRKTRTGSEHDAGNEDVMRLENKVALIFGGGQLKGRTVGNGKAVALLYAREGAKVFVVDINKEAAEETVADIRAEGGTAEAYQADITSEDDVIGAVRACYRLWKRIDVLHNNVGIRSPAATRRSPRSRWSHST